MENDHCEEQNSAPERPALSVSRGEEAPQNPLLPLPNPDGVRRAAGAFKDNPLLLELAKAIRKKKEQERVSEKAA